MADAGFRLAVEGEKEFKAAIAEINNVIKLNRSELKMLAEQYKVSTRPMDELESRQKALAEAMDLQKEKSSQIAAEIEKTSAVYGANDAQVRRLMETYNASETELAKLQGEYSKVSDAIDEASNAIKDLSDAESSINADMARFRDVLQSANAEMEEMGNSADESGKSIEDNRSRVSKLNATYAEISKSIDIQKRNIENLTENLKKADKAYGENSEETKKYRDQLNQATKALDDMTSAAEKNREKVGEINENSGGFGDMLGTVEGIAGQLGINIPDGLKNVLGGASGVTTELLGWGTAIGTAGTAIKLVIDQNKKLLETAGKYRDMYSDAQVFGVDTTEYQKLQYAMAKTGVESTELEGLFNALNGKIKEVNETVGDYVGNTKAYMALSDEEQKKVDEAIKAWGEYNVELYDQNGELRNTVDIFYDIIDVFDDYSNKTERITKLQGIFGESAAKLNPAIETGSENLRKFAEEAEETGVVLDDFTITRMQQLSIAAETQSKKVEVLGDRWNLFWHDLFNISKWGSGNLSKSASGLWDSITGIFKGYAAGTPYAPEGWARVGENGPELVHLPRGAAVYPTGVTPSELAGGVVTNNIFNITIPADNIREFNDIVKIVQGANVAYRRG